VTLSVFNEAGLLRHFNVPEARATRFFDRVYELYGANPYHNALHGQDVLSAAHCLMQQLRKLRHGPFTPLEVLALYVAALGHDAGHFGVNNAYLVNSRHALYKKSPTSTLENFHARTLAGVLTHPEDGLVDCLFSDDGAEASVGRGCQRELFLDKVNRLVLATDMAQHKGLFGEFVGWVDGELTEGRGDSDGDCDSGGGGGDGGGGEDDDSQASPWQQPLILDESQRMSLLVMTLKCADLSNLVQHLPLADSWGHRIMEENLAQGVLEERESVTQTTTPSREAATKNYYNHQAGFLEFVVKPLFEKYCVFTSSAFRCRVLEIAATNLVTWRQKHIEANGLGDEEAK